MKSTLNYHAKSLSLSTKDEGMLSKTAGGGRLRRAAVRDGRAAILQMK